MRRLYLVSSTGELEAACLSIMSGHLGYILDFSPDNVLRRNLLIASSVVEGSYLKISQNYRRAVHSVLPLFGLFFKIVLNINYKNYGSLFLKLMNLVGVEYIRDSLVPHVGAPVDCSKMRVHVEHANEEWYKPIDAKYVDADAIGRFMELVDGVSFIEKSVDCLIVGKPFRARSLCIESKERIYKAIRARYNHPVLVPHPRELSQEISIATNLGIEIRDLYLNGLSFESDPPDILLFASSVAYIFNRRNIEFIWVFPRAEFDADQCYSGRFAHLAQYSFFSVQQICDYLVGENKK